MGVERWQARLPEEGAARPAVASSPTGSGVQRSEWIATSGFLAACREPARPASPQTAKQAIEDWPWNCVSAPNDSTSRNLYKVLFWKLIRQLGDWLGLR